MNKISLKIASFCNLILLSLVSCSDLPVTRIQSDNHNDRIRFLVIHHTSINYAKSLKALTEPHGVSAHYMITEKNDSSYPDNKAEIIQLVDENKRAWQAGRSYWQG
ncbi:MAG TPA: penicillin binding protein PBP4B, partial [Aeromonadales bacterium]|nr:penicillin binding protein PBP4B [Aeromonadales bacterium]